MSPRVFKLFCLKNPNMFHLQYYKTEKNCKTSHLTGLNQRMFGVFAQYISFLIVIILGLNNDNNNGDRTLG